LKYWLDPTNTGAQFINGLDPVNPINANFDGQLSNPTGVKGINCTDTIYPSFRLSNIGTTTITSLPIQFNFDGGAVTIVNNPVSGTGNTSDFGKAIAQAI